MHVNSGVDDQQNIDGVPLFSYGICRRFGPLLENTKTPKKQ